MLNAIRFIMKLIWSYWKLPMIRNISQKRLTRIEFKEGPWQVAKTSDLWQTNLLKRASTNCNTVSFLDDVQHWNIFFQSQTTQIGVFFIDLPSRIDGASRPANLIHSPRWCKYDCNSELCQFTSPATKVLRHEPQGCFFRLLSILAKAPLKVSLAVGPARLISCYNDSRICLKKTWF